MSSSQEDKFSGGNLDRLRTEDGQPPLPGGDNVKKVVKLMNGHKRSLFSYAILSGETEAVELIYDLVAGSTESINGTSIQHHGIFGDDHKEVRGERCGVARLRLSLRLLTLPSTKTSGHTGFHAIEKR